MAACQSSHYAKTAGCSAADGLSGISRRATPCKICVRLVFPAIALAQHHQHHNRSRRSNRHNGQRYHGQCVTGLRYQPIQRCSRRRGRRSRRIFARLRPFAWLRALARLRPFAWLRSFAWLRTFTRLRAFARGGGLSRGRLGVGAGVPHGPGVPTRSGRGAWPRCSAWPRRWRSVRAWALGPGVGVGLGGGGIGVQKAHPRQPFRPGFGPRLRRSGRSAHHPRCWSPNDDGVHASS